MLKANDCGFLRLAQDIESGRSILQRVYNLPCCKTVTIRIKSDRYSADGIGQVNALTALLERGLRRNDEDSNHALKTLLLRECTDDEITLLETSRKFEYLHQLVKLEFVECFTMTRFPESIGLLTNLESLELSRCEEMQELPNSVGHLKLLTTLVLRECNCIRTLPDSIGDLKVLTTLDLRECSSLQTLQ